MPTNKPAASAGTQKDMILFPNVEQEEEDELVFEDESVLPTLKIKKHSGKTSLESSGSSDEASLHFSDVDSDHDGSSAPPVWGPTGTPNSSHGASGLFAVSDPGVSGVDKGLETTSWCSRSQDVVSSQPQLLNPAFESSGIHKHPQESIRSLNGNQTTQTLAGYDSATTPANHEYSACVQSQPFPQNTHSVPYNPTNSNSSPPLPAVNIYHLQQQHNRSHYYDPNHTNIQQIAYPYSATPTVSGGVVNSPPQMYIPAIQPTAHIPHSTTTSGKQRPTTPGTSFNNMNASMNVLANSANSSGASVMGGEWSTNVAHSEYRGDRNMEATVPSMSGYPPLYNNAASSFIANSSQNNQRGHSANRGEWSFSKRSDLGNGNVPNNNNKLHSPNGDRSQSHVSVFALHGSEAHYTNHQSFNTGSAGIGGYGSTFLPTGGGAAAPDVAAPLPQFGAVMSHPYSTYPTSPLSTQTTNNLHGNRNFKSPTNNDHHQYQQPSAFTYSHDRPVSVENWAAMSTPSHSNSVSLKRDSYPHNGGPLTPRSAQSVSPTMDPLPTPSRPPKIVKSEDGSSRTAVESSSTAVGEADISVSREDYPSATSEVVKVCRHYLEGKCNRRKCRFLHPEGLAGSEAPTQE